MFDALEMAKAPPERERVDPATLFSSSITTEPLLNVTLTGIPINTSSKGPGRTPELQFEAVFQFPLPVLIHLVVNPELTRSPVRTAEVIVNDQGPSEFSLTT